jgi:hypothetical protein
VRSLILVLVLASSALAQAPEAMLRAAMDKESVDGDLKAAIEQYKKIVSSKGANREVVAKALVRLGACYERQGDAEARKAYERVVREFGEQADSVRQAQARLAAGRSVPASGVSVRHVWDGPSTSYTGGEISPDGRYFAYADWGNGDLAVRDLSAGATRLITHMPTGNSDGVEGPCWSHDGKRIAHSFENPQWHIRVVNADGTGMRTLYKAATDEGWAYAVSWSADDKRILADVQQKDKVCACSGSMSPMAPCSRSRARTRTLPSASRPTADSSLSEARETEGRETCASWPPTAAAKRGSRTIQRGSLPWGGRRTVSMFCSPVFEAAPKDYGRKRWRTANLRARRRCFKARWEEIGKLRA